MSLADRLRRRMEERNVTAADLERAAALSRGFVSDVLNERSRFPADEKIRAIAIALGTTPEWLRGQPELSVPKVAPPRVFSVRPPLNHLIADEAAESQERDAARDDVDVDVDAETDRDAQLAGISRIRWRGVRMPFIEEPAPSRARVFRGPVPLFPARVQLSRLRDWKSGAIGTRPRPVQLLGCAGAYGVLADSTMLPRFREGEELYAEPGVEAASGDDVIVWLQGPESGPVTLQLGTLVASDKREVVVKAWAPERACRFSVCTIGGIHRIAVMVSPAARHTS